MSGITATIGRHRLLLGLLLAVVVALLAIPVTAYLVVPQFVRSTANEAPPTTGPGTAAQPSAAGASPSGSASATLLSGQLQRINAVDFGTGRVSILQMGGQRFLRFENVEIAGAPAQRVYLSDQADGRPGSFTDLGPLKATNGSFNYEIPTAVDLGKVRSVVSWCTQFKTTVTYAPLQPA